MQPNLDREPTCDDFVFRCMKRGINRGQRAQWMTIPEMTDLIMSKGHRYAQTTISQAIRNLSKDYMRTRLGIPWDVTVYKTRTRPGTKRYVEYRLTDEVIEILIKNGNIN
mgnify:FL=1